MRQAAGVATEEQIVKRRVALKEEKSRGALQSQAT